MAGISRLCIVVRESIETVFSCGKNGGVPSGLKGVDGGQPRLGWMDGVKVALGNSGMSVEAAEQFMSGEPCHICN